MQLTITAITGIALQTDQFEKLTVSTEEEIITILPGHEPIISALKP